MEPQQLMRLLDEVDDHGDHASPASCSSAEKQQLAFKQTLTALIESHKIMAPQLVPGLELLMNSGRCSSFHIVLKICST